jgi:broad specificity phosphatase PhoE
MHDEPVTFNSGDDTNISLNIYGRAQASEAAVELPDTIGKIYSAPLLRVRETAEIIAGVKNLDFSKIELRDELVEYHQGSMEGLSSAEKKNMLKDGQSWGSGLLCNELKKEGTEENIVCVTSAGVIRMAYKILLSEKSPGITKHLIIKNGSVHEFVI